MRFDRLTPIQTILTVGIVIGLAVGTNRSDKPRLYYGLLHAHTLLSDGVGTPDDAYRMAKEAGLDFFAITPHNHADAERGAKDRADGITIAELPELYSGTQPVSITRTWKKNGVEHSQSMVVTPLIASARANSSERFLALFGQELSTISTGNHMNVFGAPDVIRVANGDVGGLVEHMAGSNVAMIGQFNHPDVHADLFYGGSSASSIRKMFNDYGIDSGDLGPHFADLVRRLDPYVQLIELISGPAMKKRAVPDHAHRPLENDYFFYLKQGFHLCPSVGQDNHYDTWGKTTPARMGIWANGLSQEAVFDAFRHYRTFATEDANLSIQFSINGQAMGSMVEYSDKTELNMRIEILDSNEPQAEYTIFVYGAPVLAEHSKRATKSDLDDGLLASTKHKGNGVVRIGNVFTKGGPEFYFIKLVQEDGNRLWSAPIWVNHPEELVRFGTAAPAGR